MSMTPDQKTVIEYLQKGEEYERFIFNRLKGLDWFEFLDDQDFFSPDKNPQPIEDANNKGYFSIPKWPALDFLEKVADECSSPENKKYAERLMVVVQKVTRPHDSKTRADNYRTWHSFVKIMANLPTDVITLKDIDLVRDWLDSRFETVLVGSEIGKGLLPKLLASGRPDDWKKATKLVEVITGLKPVPRKTKKYSEAEPDEELELKIPSFWMRELFKKNAGLLGQRCGKEVTISLKTRLAELLAKCRNEDEYAYVWRPAIEDHEQNVGEDQPNHVLVTALRDVMLSYANHAPVEEAAVLLMEIIESELDITKRIAIYVIDSLFDKFGFLFWEKLDSNLFRTNLRHEMYMLLGKHFESFSPEQMDKIVTLISQLTRDWKADADKEKMDALLRAEWLRAVIGKGSEKAAQLYEEYKKLLGGQDPEHPEFISYTTSGSFSEESPITPTELLAMGSVKEIVGYVNGFEGKNRWDKPSCEGLGESLKAAVKTQPDLFTNDLSEFLKCKFPYQYFVIDAFKDLSRDKKILDWGKILAFCKALVEWDALWMKDDKDKDWCGRKEWIPTAIAELIESGIKEDERAFDEKHMPQAEEVLNTILEKQKPPELAKEREDFVNWAINTQRGRSLEAFLTYALHCIRVVEKNEQQKEVEWKKLEPVFDQELNETQKGNYEFSALAGRYLPNLYYMSKEWVERNIGLLFPNKDPKFAINWRAALDGYSHVSTVYTVIYNLLKANGDFKKVLDEILDHRRLRERVIDNIAVSYLRGQESLEEGLFAQILKSWRREDIVDVIGLFWTHREVDFQNQEDKRILAFWKYCCNKIKDKEQENQEILSDLNLLAVFLKQIDRESKDWLLQSVPYVEKRYHSTFLLEYLDRLADANPKEVGEVFVAMLKSAVPTFKEENVKSIVAKLYKSGHNELANTICDRYGRAGCEFLRELYEKNN